MDFKKKKVKVIMSPTNDVTGIKYNFFLKSISKEMPGLGINREKYLSYQHLYFITEDKIQIGDYCLDIESNIVFQYKCLDFGMLCSDDYSAFENTCKKVVATTDTKLGLPKPSKTFIKKYIEQGKIDEVSVEQEGFKLNGMPDEATRFRLKTNSNNEIFISLIKNSWSKKEVEELFEKHRINFINEKVLASGMLTKDRNMEWIKENL